MKGREALRVLAEVSESQWGLVTSAQASARGVSHMNLTRLAEAGDLVRLSHGVYRDAGAPSEQYEELRAAWLASDPSRLAYERLKDSAVSVTVSGESAAKLHGIGDFRAMKSEFTTPTRRQTQRADIKYRTRQLPEQDITVHDGLPVTTRERTIADLVEDRQDLSTIGDALRDATRQSTLDLKRLASLLSPLAERNGQSKGDGYALVEDLMRIAGIDQEAIAKQIASIPVLNDLIVTDYLTNISKADLTWILETVTKISDPPKGQIEEMIKAIEWTVANHELPAIPDVTAITESLLAGHDHWSGYLKSIDLATLAMRTRFQQKE